MKKLVLKLSVLVMILTLVTLPLVSGTYAKYATEASGIDSMRVAEWGVRIDGNDPSSSATLSTDNLFTNTYHATGGALTEVVSEDAVVAPGTTGAFTFSVAGIPETAYNLKVDVTASYSGAWIGTTGASYYPVIYLLDGHIAPVVAGPGYSAGSLEALVYAVESLAGTAGSDNKNYAANTNIATTLGHAGMHEISWIWAFSGTDTVDTVEANSVTGQTDIEDTFIGGLFVNIGNYINKTTGAIISSADYTTLIDTTPAAAANYTLIAETHASFALAITVTQIDQ